MNAPAHLFATPERPCDAAMRKLKSLPLEPVMRCHWERALFINLEVDKTALQREVPFALDLYEGRAFVSLVAFNVTGLRPWFGGRASAALFRPLQIGELFNVRTYVRCNGETGIYFLAEWMGSRLNLRLGPLSYGLPYRYGKLTYRHEHESGDLQGLIRDHATRNGISYHCRMSQPFRESAPGSLDEFLVERYTCFTHFGGPRRHFRIWHEPWPQARVEVTHFDRELLVANWPWLENAKVISANYSPGLEDIWLGRPHLVKAHARSAFLKMP